MTIGSTSFGGYTALISFVQRKLVEQYQWLTEEDVIDGVTVASILPGPLAVNVVAYIGYKLKGWGGVAVSMVAVLLPSFLMMILAAELYVRYNELEMVQRVISGILLVICAIIASVVFKMSKNNIKSFWQIIIAGISFIALFFSSSYWLIIAMILVGGMAGVFFSKKSFTSDIRKHKETGAWKGILVIITTAILLVVAIQEEVLIQLTSVFAKASLTLFGGGYVMIPVLHQLVVIDHHWLTSESFSVAISLGQMTPGPILVSATYVGYLVKGLSGAIVSTIAIFLPSALLMIIVSERMDRVKSNPYIQKALTGIRPVIIGLIGFSFIIIFQSQDFTLLRLAMVLVATVLLIFARVNEFLLILVFGCLGAIIF